MVDRLLDGDQDDDDAIYIIWEDGRRSLSTFGKNIFVFLCLLQNWGVLVDWMDTIIKDQDFDGRLKTKSTMVKIGIL